MTPLTAAACAVALAAGSLAGGIAEAADPKVPPGIDGGGVAVAIVGDGLDYRRPELLPRLARDGEGELVGWDFADDDRRPFAATGGADGLAALLIATSPARLVPIRVARGEERQIAQALRLLGDMPARIVLVSAEPGAPIDRAKLAAASRGLPRLLIVVPARLVASAPGVPAVEPSDATGLLVAAAAPSAAADAWVPAGPSPGPGGVHADDLAAARLAALAARMLTGEPALAGAALRARLLSLVASGSDGSRAFPGIERLP
jgi:hypothetical protein